MRKVADECTKEQKQELNKMAQPKKKRKEEKIDWAEIMGMNRDTYKRVNGAIRRR